MNRRDILKTAIGALAMPSISAVQATEAAGKFVVVVECDNLVTERTAAYIREQLAAALRPAFGEIPVVVLVPGISMRIEPASAQQTTRAVQCYTTRRDAEPSWILEAQP